MRFLYFFRSKHGQCKAWHRRVPAWLDRVSSRRLNHHSYRVCIARCDAVYFDSVTVIVFLVLRAIHERARERVVVRVGRGSIRVLCPLMSRLRVDACCTPRVLFSAREKCALVSAAYRLARLAGNHFSVRLRMYVCMVITYSRVWINRVRLPILLVVS